MHINESMVNRDGALENKLNNFRKKFTSHKGLVVVAMKD